MGWNCIRSTCDESIYEGLIDAGYWLDALNQKSEYMGMDMMCPPVTWACLQSADGQEHFANALLEQIATFMPKDSGFEGAEELHEWEDADPGNLADSLLHEAVSDAAKNLGAPDGGDAAIKWWKERLLRFEEEFGIELDQEG